MSLGFGVEALLPDARGGGRLRMGLSRLGEEEWLQPHFDGDARKEGFAAFPEGVQIMPEANEPGRELAAMLRINGALGEAALSAHEDMCLLVRRQNESAFRLVGTAVAWPSDWLPAEKIGLPLRALHAPIEGYEDQLADGVDRFMAGLAPGAIYGRCNWFIAPTGARRWIAEELPKRPFSHVTAANAGETLFVRSERQTLRCLPHTGAVLFTIGIYVEPLSQLSDSNIARLADAIRALPRSEGDRRASPAYGEALIEFAKRRSAS